LRTVVAFSSAGIVFCVPEKIFSTIGWQFNMTQKVQRGYAAGCILHNDLTITASLEPER
jgi:hypothetical protein